MRTPTIIHNPVLRGFNPDPSFVRVGDDYYLATSTFEWFPGVQLHHSRDLVNWRLIGHALTHPSQLNLQGVADSAGVWAPSLSYHEGKFYLIYTVIRTTGMGRPFKDIGIFLATAEHILGPWSEPIFLNSVGFDPSLFHDDDGRKWLVNIQWDFRKGKPRFGGIVLQEYDTNAHQMVGPLHRILTKNELIEGPNLYKKDGWYYLMLAEGGTGWNHGISMARSRSITGPYELDPQGSMLTTRDIPTHRLQKAGHGELVQTPMGEWWLAHLCSRPLKTDAQFDPKSPDQSTSAHARVGYRCPLGRETALQRVVWSQEGWLRLAADGTTPQVEVAAPQELAPQPWPEEPTRDEFNSSKLGLQWAALRRPIEESWASLEARPGWLRLIGGESLHSHFEQSLVANRLQEFRVRAETCMEFEPTHFAQMAGLIAYYDTRTHYYLRVTHDEEQGRMLGIVLSDDGVYDELLDSQIAVNEWSRYFLRAEIDCEALQFFASPNGDQWQAIGPVLDASKLSDDYGTGLHFTGAFVGLCAQDLNGARTCADFAYFQLDTRAIYIMK